MAEIIDSPAFYHHEEPAWVGQTRYGEIRRFAQPLCARAAVNGGQNAVIAKDERGREDQAPIRGGRCLLKRMDQRIAVFVSERGRIGRAVKSAARKEIKSAGK